MGLRKTEVIIAIFLVLGTAAAVPVKENLGQYSMSFSTPLVDSVKALPAQGGQTSSSLGYQSFGLELYNGSGKDLGSIIVTQFAGHLSEKILTPRRRKSQTV